MGAINEWVGKARTVMGNAGSNATRVYDGAKKGGVIPTKLDISDDGEVIPPLYVWWAPWMARAFLALSTMILCGIAGVISGGGDIIDGAKSTFALALVIGTIQGSIAFRARGVWTWMGTIVALPLIVAVLFAEPVLAVSLAIMGVITALVGRLYKQADFDSAVAGALSEITGAKKRHGRGFLLEEIIENDSAGTLVTLGSSEGGAPKNSRIRHIPDGVGTGWYIVVDPARRYMAGMSPAMLRRVEALGQDR